MKTFGDKVTYFVCAKYNLNCQNKHDHWFPASQGNLRLKKTEQIILIYKETSEKVDELHQSRQNYQAKNLFGIKEKWSQPYVHDVQQINWNNFSKTIK